MISEAFKLIWRWCTLSHSHSVVFLLFNCCYYFLYFEFFFCCCCDSLLSTFIASSLFSDLSAQKCSCFFLTVERLVNRESTSRIFFLLQEELFFRSFRVSHHFQATSSILLHLLTRSRTALFREMLTTHRLKFHNRNHTGGSGEREDRVGKKTHVKQTATE